MSSGVMKRSLLGLAHIVLPGLSLVWGVALAQTSSDLSEVRFVTDSVRASEGTSQSILLERYGSVSPYSGPATAKVSVVGGTAQEGIDYTFSSPQDARWDSGESGLSNNTLEIILLDDRDDEVDETVILRIVDVSGDASRGSPFEHTVTIQNIAPPPYTEIQFQKDFYSGFEDGNVQVGLERTLASGGSMPIGAASAEVRLVGGSASNDDTSFSSPTTVNWGAGDSASKFIDISLYDDSELESTENFFLEIVRVDGDAVLGGVPRTEIEIGDRYPGELVYVGEPFEVVEDAVNNFVDVQIERVGGSAGQVNVTIGADDITAVEGIDYELDGSRQLNWNDGETGIRSVRYRAIPDTDDEGDETFEVSVVDGFRNIGPGISKVTIIDGAPALNAGQVDFVDSVYSGSEAGGSIALTLRRSGGSDGDVMASVNLFDVTATFPFDGSLPGSENVATVAWSDGETADKTVILSIEQDLDGTEGQERFDVDLSGPTNGLAIGTANPKASVLIDDSPPPMPGSIAFDPDFYTVNEADRQLTLNVTRSGGSDGVVTVDFDILDGTGPGEATEGSDFTLADPASQTLRWGNGDSAPKLITFDITDDIVFEDRESFVVDLFNPTGGAFFDSSSTQALVDIIDNDPPPSPGTLSFSSDYTVSESMLSVSVEVTRTGGSDGRVTGSYRMGESGDSATLGEDYAMSTAPNGELVWEDGDSTSKFIEIDITLDDQIETDEQFSVSIVDTTGGASFSDIASVITITDTPPPADEVRFVNATDSIAEDGDFLGIELRRSGSGAGDVEVFYELVSGTASFGPDFRNDSGGSGSVFWPSGDLADKTIGFDIIEDLEIEGDETFTLQLSIGSGAGNVSLGTPNSTTITIIDVPPPMPGILQFNPDGYTVSEMDGSVELVVTRTGGSDGPASVTYTVGSDTATVGVDHAVNAPVSGLLEWSAGDATPRSITVDIAADDLIETIETFPVQLSAASGAALGQATSATVSIMDSTEPDVVVLANDAITISEGVGTLSIVVQRIGAGTDAVSINYSISDGTAVSPDDYGNSSAVSGTVNWATGDTADKTIDIDIVPDLILEDDETFLLSLTPNPASSPVTLGSPSQTLVTIVDVPPPTPGIVQFDPDVYTVAESDGLLELIVTRTGGSDGAASAAFEFIGDSAELGTDFAVTEPVSGTLEWLDGDDTSRTITIDVANDALVEGSEEFTVLLSAITGSVAGSATTATVTLMDSTVPTPDTIVFADDSIEVEEDAGLVSLVVQRVGTGTEAVSVSYEITDDTALSGADYGASEPLTGTVSWAAGDTADKSIVIDVLSDDVVEENETFQVTLSPVASSAPVLIGTPDTITVAIIDTTIPPLPDVIALTDTGQIRLESEPMFELAIIRTGNGIGGSSVDWVLSPGSASLSDDINLADLSGTVSWADGQTGSQLVEIPIVNDELDEPNETLTLTLVNVQGASLGTPASSLLTITDDDEPPVPGSIQFSVDSINVAEDAGVVALTVTRTGGSDGLITVSASTVPGSAGAADFSAIQTELSWNDGDTSTREIVVPITFDTSTESTESFSVSLSGATPDDSVLGSPTTVTVNINDVFNGSRGTVQFASGTASVDETDNALTVSVTRVGGTDGAIGVNYSTSAGSATAGDDFDNTSGTLSWADGDGAPKTFSVAIANDTLAEDAEQFSVTLSNATPVGAETIGTPDTLIVTINNVEPPPEPEPVAMPGTVQFVSSAISSNESAGTISVSVERTGGTDGAVSVRYNTVADSAVEGDDYQPASGRLQWADGEDDVKTVSIAVNVDDEVEDDERFRMVLSDGQPGEAILGTPSSVDITIVDDSIAPPGVLAFVQATLEVAESDGIVELQVARTGGSAGSVSVGYTTVERSADSTDFVPVSGRLNWPDGDTDVRTIRVTVNRDVLVEPIEQFQVVLDEAQPLGDADQLGVSLATVSISDSTRLGSLGFLATEISVSESNTSVSLSVERSGGSDGDVSVDFSTIGSSADPGSDFGNQTGTLTWPDGDAEPRSITILINSDNMVEGSEQFVVALSNPQPQGDQQLGDAQATITIIDATPADDDTTQPITTLGSLDLVVVSGDGQGGLPGDLLEPLVIDVVDLEDSGAAVDGLPIRWRAVPEGSAELLDGGRTVSDEAGRSSNRVRILSRGFLNVVATIDVSSTATSGMTTRIMPPEFPVGQGEAVFTVRSGLFAADGLNNNQAAVGATLDAACEILGVRIEQQESMTAEEQDLFATCQEVEARLSNDDGLAAALDRLLPEELFSIGDSVIDTTDIQVTNVYSRINAIRSGRVETLDIAGLQFRHYDQSIPGSVINAAQNELSGGGAAADGALGSSRLGFFANGSVSYGDVDGGENQSNASVETTGLTLGIDYRATDNSAFGAGLGIISNTTDFNPDAGKAEVSGLNLTLFGTYYKNRTGYLDAVLDFGRNSYDITRRINLPNTPDQFGIGDTTADVMSLTVGAGRDFTRGAWEFGPYGRFSYIDADVDGYSERASGSTEGFGSVLNVRAHSVRSTRLALGGQLARTVSTTRAVFIPQLRVEAEFEQEDKKEGIQATFQHDPTQTPFTVNGEDRDTSYFNLGIGSSAFFANGRSGFLFYETQLGNDRVTQHFLKLGIRLEF